MIPCNGKFRFTLRNPSLFKIPPILVGLLLVAAISLTPVDSHADVLIVDPEHGPFYTIRSAFLHAVPNDTVEVVPGTYDAIPQPYVRVTLRSQGGPETTIFDGQGSRRIADLRNVDLTIEGFTFQNGLAASGGPAIRYAGCSLELKKCVFRGNRAPGTYYMIAFGGAILAGTRASGSFVDCLFIDNEVSGGRGGRGGAVAIWPGFDKSVSEDPAATPETTYPRYRFSHCSFISNRARYDPGILSSEIIEIENCLFVDRAGSRGDWISAPAGSQSRCLIWQDGLSPQVEGTWSKRSDSGAIDPRLCPDNREAVHETSPTLSDWQGCGRIGNLPVGCYGCVVLAVRPLRFEPMPNQALRLYGYGLEEVLDARLVGPSGERVITKEQSVDGPWMNLIFDLDGQSPGDWSLTLRTATDGEVHVDNLLVSPVRAYGFFNGWVSEPILFEGRIGGRGLKDDMVLTLRPAEQAGWGVPVEILESIDDDTLLVRADLRVATAGAYDLEIVTPSGAVQTLHNALYLGQPPVIRVPEDAPTVQEALDTAPPGAEIVVGLESSEETLTITKPVRLRRSGQLEYARLKPDSTGGRVIHILEEAGPLTEIEGFIIHYGAVSGPGGGVYSEAPARIHDNWISNNKADGPGGRGGGIWAAPGSRIIENTIYYNEASAPVAPDDPWSTDPETGGVGGGLFCLDCWVEGNRIESNVAIMAGGLVADGVIRNNAVFDNWVNYWDYYGSWLMGAVRGEITGNRFDNCCGSVFPYLLVEGPSRLTSNLFTEIIWELCSYSNSIHLKGSIDLVENIFGSVGIEACLRTDPVREPRPGHFRMERNYFEEWWGQPVNLYLDDAVGTCLHTPADPYEAIPPDSIVFSCNYGYADVEYHDRSGSRACTDCVIRLENVPEGCPDTIPSFEYACDWDPPTPQSWGLEPTDKGIRLFWSLAEDARVAGFDIERESVGEAVRLTGKRLASCKECEFIDRDPPEQAVYTLLVHSGSAEPTRFPLGEWNGEHRLLSRPGLGMPSPHPIRGATTLRFTLPPGQSDLRLEVLDLQGRSITVIRQGFHPPGTYSVVWDGKGDHGRPIASGVYLLRLSTDSRVWSHKILLVR